MSTVVANSISGTELFLFADTIVTRSRDENAKVGYTSHGERYQPLTDKAGNVLGFSESACKVGKLNDLVMVAFAGDVEFTYSILDFIYAKRDSLRNAATIHGVAQSAAINNTPSSFAIGSRGEVLFCSSGQGLEICRCIFTVDNNKQVTLNFDSKLVSPAQAFQIIVGSGKEFLGSYLPKDIFQSCASDPSLLSLGVQMLSMDFSRELRRQTNDQAVGVGGAFLGFKLDPSGVNIPRDSVHISANSKGEVLYCTKISYQSGLFFITDYINRTINVVRTIDAELAFRARSQSSTDVTELVRNASRFAAPIVLLSHYSEEQTVLPTTDIVESAGDDALKGNAPKDGFIWFERKTHISFKSKDGKEMTFFIP